MTPASHTTERPKTRCDHPRGARGLLVSGGVTALTLTVAFGLLALDVEYFWVVFVVGFGVALPTALGVVGHGSSDGADDGGRSETDAETALAALREQYARGELTDAEFERRVERLLESTSGAGYPVDDVHSTDSNRADHPDS